MKKMTLTSLCLVFIFAFSAYALKEDTHRAINEEIAQRNINGFSWDTYIKNQLGFSKGVNEDLSGIDAEGRNVKKKIYGWLGYGGEQEDRPGSNWDYIQNNPSRSNNHFHNPLKPWDQAGLDDWVTIRHYTGQSSVLWAQNTNQTLGGNWSWQDARNYFYSALISTNKTQKDENFARTFRAVGQQMHLIEDASVPEHVRNAAHPDMPMLGIKYYEGHVLDFQTKPDVYGTFWNDLLSNPITFDKSILNITSTYPSAPVTISRIIDTDLYTGDNPNVTTTLYNSPQPIGIAEYANANFLSKDTMFNNYIHPRVTDTVLWIDNNKKEYVKKTTGSGDIINHLAVTSWLHRYRRVYFPQYTEYYPLSLDEECYKEYATNLIPRAVGYSAGLLNYFFRGSINISIPANGFYSIIDTTQPGYNPAFTSIKLMATNTTSTGEHMTNGTIQLVVKYKVAHADPFRPGPVETDADFSYIVAPEKNNVSALYSATPTELNFDLSQNPIPLWATDVYLQVVFKGTLGNEVGAVAVGFKDISEPTPMDMFSNTDMICINGNWYVAGSPQAIAQVDTNNNGIADYPSEGDVYGHDPQDIYMTFAPYSETPPTRIASPSFYDAKVSGLAADNHIRALYILSDYQFDKVNYEHWVKRDAADQWPQYNRRYWFIDYAIKRQTDYSEDSQTCGDAPPCYVDYYPGEGSSFNVWEAQVFYTFRGAQMWWGSAEIYINYPYPSGSQCNYDLLQ